ncbi:Hypothetical_protein [Hexamita inflata]|uniref:Hypothetical_protein n=1 Tax=Hexamita inflata TaxID=28002 RepID=A0AA86Q2D8_9EUKA|nr:Hypothetical protein HINF_LOCUS38539 [Hexamita inflata]CAI9950897.1 Hypothetical protein HINF_LOCUS38542 [Hexamita inflata]
MLEFLDYSSVSMLNFCLRKYFKISFGVGSVLDGPGSGFFVWRIFSIEKHDQRSNKQAKQNKIFFTVPLTVDRPDPFMFDSEVPLHTTLLSKKSGFINALSKLSTCFKLPIVYYANQYQRTNIATLIID